MLIPVVERSIEGMHARMKQGLLQGRSKNAVSLSLVNRWDDFDEYIGEELIFEFKFKLK